MGKGTFDDLTGRQFGLLTVKSYEGSSRWACVCECGTAKIVLGQSLRRGATKSCDANKHMGRHHAFIDLTGQKFGKWTVLCESTTQKGWKCRCECGTESVVLGQSLREGRSKSCGCTVESLQAAGAWRTKKGHDLTGFNIGFLTYIRQANIDGRYALWQCACGNVKIAKRSNVLSGQVKSCGCARKAAQRLLSVTRKVNAARLGGCSFCLKQGHTVHECPQRNKTPPQMRIG